MTSSWAPSAVPTRAAAEVPLPDASSAGASAPGDVDMGEDEPVKVLNAPALPMLDNLMKTLEADGQEWVLHQEGKLVVGIITKAIKPAPLQLAVTKQLQLQRNKVLKSDVFRYVKWLRQFAIGYQLYGGMDEERPSKAPAEEPRKENSRPRPRFSPVPEEKRPSGASAAPPTWRADKRDEPTERPKPKCLKCQSTAHRVREHPGITDAEVKKLMDDFHQARRRSVNFVSSTKPANSMECQASIEDVLTLPKVLLDSGSDDTLVSEGLLVALERLRASLNIETKPRLMLKPYGETTKPLHVTRQDGDVGDVNRPPGLAWTSSVGR
ncbi:hypothetical protein DYB38_012223 [Aphanomyces astaci]|uniref:Peptidase A2 domain-containing protein n=1 Tax=Aphanomyces astaci TaxID=112090 RepID=A0A397D443_APHAT|nr:hypothetical protein DYB38_012223 [Aphanomyces astaci]